MNSPPSSTLYNIINILINIFKIIPYEPYINIFIYTVCVLLYFLIVVFFILIEFTANFNNVINNIINILFVSWSILLIITCLRILIDYCKGLNSTKNNYNLSDDAFTGFCSIHKTVSYNMLYIVIGGLIFSILKSYNKENVIYFYNILLPSIEIFIGFLILIFIFSITEKIFNNSSLVRGIALFWLINLIVLLSGMFFVSLIIDNILVGALNNVKNLNSSTNISTNSSFKYKLTNKINNDYSIFNIVSNEVDKHNFFNSGIGAKIILIITLLIYLFLVFILSNQIFQERLNKIVSRINQLILRRLGYNIKIINID